MGNTNQLLGRSIQGIDKIDLVLGDPEADKVWDEPTQTLLDQRVIMIDRDHNIFRTDGLAAPVSLNSIWDIRRSFGKSKREYDYTLTLKRIAEIEASDHWRRPVVDEPVYVGSSYYIDHGEDDFCGGKATIRSIEREWFPTNPYNALSVTLHEHPGHQHNWYALMESEPETRERYDGEAHPCPDVPSGSMIEYLIQDRPTRW
jgi:hypothetical protein